MLSKSKGLSVLVLCVFLFFLFLLILIAVTHIRHKQHHHIKESTNPVWSIGTPLKSDFRGLSIGSGHLYVAGWSAPYNCPFLTEAQITLVINAASELRDPWDDERFDQAKTKCPIIQTIRYLRLNLQDSHRQDILSILDSTNQEIEQELARGGNVLIHCAAGISRSAAIAMAFLISHEGIIPEEALGRLREVRPQAQPNKHFYQQLQQFASLRLPKDVQSKRPLQQTLDNKPRPTTRFLIDFFHDMGY